MTIAYSRGKNLHDTRPRLREVADLDELTHVLRCDHGRRAEKRSSPYIAGPVRGTRCASNALPRAWLAVDADHIDPAAMQRWREFWQPHDTIVWPTHTSRPEAPRERVVVALDRPADRVECNQIGAVISEMVKREFGNAVEIDPSTYRPEQPIFLPPPKVDLIRNCGRPIRVMVRVAEEAAPQPPHLRPQLPSVSSESSVSLVSSVSSVGVLCAAADEGFEIPAKYLPTAPGQRNKRLFGFARFLKGAMPSASREQRQEIVERWHQLALPYINTKDPDITLSDFERSWLSARTAEGAVMSEIVLAAELAPIPPGLERLGYRGAALRLARLCRELAKHHAPDPFFLGARAAGDVLALHYTDANSLLRQLALDGVIQVVERGSGSRASRYRWTWKC